MQPASYNLFDVFPHQSHIGGHVRHAVAVAPANHRAGEVSQRLGTVSERKQRCARWRWNRERSARNR